MRYASGATNAVVQQWLSSDLGLAIITADDAAVRLAISLILLCLQQLRLKITVTVRVNACWLLRKCVRLVTHRFHFDSEAAEYNVTETLIASAYASIELGFHNA